MKPRGARHMSRERLTTHCNERADQLARQRYARHPLT
jgi:hypothetical protein